MRFRVTKGGDVTFFICEEVNFSLWREGNNVSFCAYYPMIIEGAVNWVSPADGTYCFVFDNTNSSAAKNRGQNSLSVGPFPDSAEGFDSVFSRQNKASLEILE